MNDSQKTTQTQIEENFQEDKGFRFYIKNAYGCKSGCATEDAHTCEGCQEDYLYLRQKMVASLSDEQIKEIREDAKREENIFEAISKKK